MGSGRLCGGKGELEFERKMSPLRGSVTVDCPFYRNFTPSGFKKQFQMNEITTATIYIIPTHNPEGVQLC